LTVLEEVLAERVRQDARWGVQNHDPSVWLMILGEEVGEAVKAALEAWADDSCYSSYPHLREYRRELLQVAAVAVAMAESVDRNELRREPETTAEQVAW
jgi:hypothetical protein